jgi:sortase (surface protein transpeptidase)
MSFFSSLQQYVTSGVAGLGLNSRRFSLSRQDSAEQQQQQQQQQTQQQQPQTQASPQQQEKTPTHGELSISCFVCI